MLFFAVLSSSSRQDILIVICVVFSGVMSLSNWGAIFISHSPAWFINIHKRTFPLVDCLPTSDVKAGTTLNIYLIFISLTAGAFSGSTAVAETRRRETDDLNYHKNTNTEENERETYSFSWFHRSFLRLWFYSRRSNGSSAILSPGILFLPLWTDRVSNFAYL